MHNLRCRQSLRPCLAGTILGGNYLIAQQLPTSSPYHKLFKYTTHCHYLQDFFLKKFKVFSLFSTQETLSFQGVIATSSIHATVCFFSSPYLVSLFYRFPIYCTFYQIMLLYIRYEEEINIKEKNKIFIVFYGPCANNFVMHKLVFWN